MFEIFFIEMSWLPLSRHAKVTLGYAGNVRNMLVLIANNFVQYRLPKCCTLLIKLEKMTRC